MGIGIALDNIGKSFKVDAGSLPVLRDISFPVAANKVTSIIGPSGCGKTVLLKIIAGLLRPSSGRVVMDNPGAAGAKGRVFGFCSQQPALLPWRCVLDNIRFPGEILRSREVLDNAAAMARLVGLQGFEHYYPHQLSGGMKARVALAMVLGFHPRVLLLDEPFANLDELTRENLNLELLRIWKSTGSTIVLVTHNIYEAVFLSDVIIVLTPRPARIMETVVIDAPRPRFHPIRNSVACLEKIERIRDLLRAGNEQGVPGTAEG